MRAALAIVSDHGLHALTMRAIARRTRTSHVALYRHFQDKEALLAAIAEEGFGLLRERMLAAAQQVSDPLDQFHNVGLSYIEFSRRNPGHFQLMYARELSDRRAHPGLRGAAAQAFGFLIEVLRRGQAEGSIVAGDPVELALSAWSLVHGLAVLLADRQFEDAGVSDERVIAAALDRFHAGLSAHLAGRRR